MIIIVVVIIIVIIIIIIIITKTPKSRDYRGIFRTIETSIMIMKPLTTQSAFTCSKLTIETVEQGVQYVIS